MRTSTILATAVLSLFFFVNIADASLQVGDTIRFLNGPGSPGGEFGVAMAGQSTPVLFTTFCIETNELLDFNSDGFDIVNISTGAVNGGESGGNPDPIEGQTAWLFLQFTKGTLAGYDGSAASANSLQNAIWHFEGESNNGDLTYVNLANAQSQSDLDDALKVVRVLNLEWATSRGAYTAGDNAQDVLYVIPEPATLLVWSALGCLGFAAYRRRVKRA